MTHICHLFLFFNQSASAVEVFSRPSRVRFDDFTVTHSKSPMIQAEDYYPFGLVASSYRRENSLEQNYLYNGKELQDELNLGWLDYGARMYIPEIGRWGVVDNMTEKFNNSSPYNYAVNNPIIFIDIDGNEWFYYSVDGNSDPTWNWRNENEYHTGVMDESGKEVVLNGTEAVVVFNGHTKEQLGVKAGHVAGSRNKSNQYLNSNSIIDASVTVYGPDGPNDISHYKGYTNSSDPNSFGVVADGIYDGEYKNPGKGGSLSSNWALTGDVPARFGTNPAFPARDPGYLNGVYIHSVNSDGWAGTWNDNNSYKGVSQGCLLISRSQWDAFNEQMTGVQNFKVQIIRTIHPITIYNFMKKAFPNIPYNSSK